MKPGLFVSFEGGEGAGKSTALIAASAVLGREQIRYRVTREPGGTTLGNALRALVLDPLHVDICAQSEALIMFAARAQHVVDVIRPALAAGEWVLCDRYTDASYAYQGGGRGIDAASLAALERLATSGLVPDRTFLLDIAVDEGLRRVAQRGASDRIERERTDFFERVRAAYLDRAQREPQRILRVDASLPAVDVAATVEADLLALAARWRA